MLFVKKKVKIAFDNMLVLLFYNGNGDISPHNDLVTFDTLYALYIYDKALIGRKEFLWRDFFQIIKKRRHRPSYIKAFTIF